MTLTLLTRPTDQTAVEIGELLTRNGVEYRTIDPVNDPVLSVVRGSADGLSLPMLIKDTGERVVAPSIAHAAEFAGLATRPSKKMYDVAVIGGGPAGLTAAVYAASEGLSVCVIERVAPGGQAGTSAKIENYLGFPDGIEGEELANAACTQALRFGAEILVGVEPTFISQRDAHHHMVLGNGACVNARTVIVATGVTYRRLEVDGVEDFIGCGVTYGSAPAEFERCAGEHCVVVGGANSAGQAVVKLSEIAAHVTMLVRGPEIESSMSQYLIQEIAGCSNVTIMTETEVAAVHGRARLEAIDVVRHGVERTLEIDRMFIMIGGVPRVPIFDPPLDADDHGFVDTGDTLLETSTPGVFVIGDVRSGGIKRVASAVGDGAMAVQLAHRFLGS